VNASADHAFANTTGITDDDELGDIIKEVHTVEAGVGTTETPVGSSFEGTRSPGGGWTRVSRPTDTTADASSVGGSGPRLRGWRTVDSERYKVTVTNVTTRSWEKGNETTTTVSIRERTYRVGVSVGAKTVPVDGVPEGRIDGHLSDAADRAADRAVGRAGGFDGVAEAAALDEFGGSRARATADPSIERTDVESDLEAFAIGLPRSR